MKVFVRGYYGQGFGSGFIRRFTFGEISHVSFVFEKGSEREEIEAIQGRGVVAHKPVEGKEYVEYALPLDEDQAIALHIEARSLIGCAYDWAGVFGFVRRKKKHNPYKYFCSELVAYCCYKAGYPLSRREPWRETPSSVCESFRLLAPVEEAGHA